MISVRDLSPGVKVRIVDNWVSRTHVNPRMDKWLGQTMTVHKVVGQSVLMEEDAGECPGNIGASNGGWVWDDVMIEEIVPDETLLSFERPTEEDIYSFLGIRQEV